VGVKEDQKSSQTAKAGGRDASLRGVKWRGKTRGLGDANGGIKVQKATQRGGPETGIRLSCSGGVKKSRKKDL